MENNITKEQKEQFFKKYEAFCDQEGMELFFYPLLKPMTNGVAGIAVHVDVVKKKYENKIQAVKGMILNNKPIRKK